MFILFKFIRIIFILYSSCSLFCYVCSIKKYLMLSSLTKSFEESLNLESKASDTKKMPSVIGISSKCTSLNCEGWEARCMGVNKSGKLAVLAGRQGFLVVDLDNPQTPTKYPIRSKWEPFAFEWNPHAANDKLFASERNQKLEVWNVEELSSRCPRVVLSNHTTAISNINWNCFEPHMLLTCSKFMHINLWDLRQTLKPSLIFTSVAGSSQVKWNRKNKNLFATAHEGDLRIWDVRNGNNPLVYITGHMSNIRSIDWSPYSESQLITASSDSSVKFWNIYSPLRSQGSISPGSPVWRAQFTPFGFGLVTVQHDDIDGDNSIFLWKTPELINHIHQFNGHTDTVLDFEWRSHTIGDKKKYQLISWSKDQTLKIWHIEKKVAQAITGRI